MKIHCLILFVILFISCDKVSDTELDGKWQLQQIMTDGVIEKVDTIYYNFQNTLFQYQIYNKQTDSFAYSYGFKTKQDNSDIYLEFAIDPKYPIEWFLKKTDWKSKSRTFTVDKKTGNQLILSSEGKQYTFRKF